MGKSNVRKPGPSGVLTLENSVKLPTSGLLLNPTNHSILCDFLLLLFKQFLLLLLLLLCHSYFRQLLMGNAGNASCKLTGPKHRETRTHG